MFPPFARIIRRCFAACVALAWLQTALAAAEPGFAARAAHPRLIYNDDGFNFLGAADDLSVRDLRAYLARLRGTQVDLVAYGVPRAGM